MRRTGFYFITEDPDPMLSRGDKKRRESDGFVCAHCNHAVFVAAFCDPADAGGLCRVCNGLICTRPQCHYGCTPFEKKLELIEARRLLVENI